MFGFTGTPIFEQNAASMDGRKRTTKELFEECLHKYVITDAIKDENVLKFSVEYVGRYKQKDTATEIDIEVDGGDTFFTVPHPEQWRELERTPAHEGDIHFDFVTLERKPG